MSAVFFLFSAFLIRIFWPKIKPGIHWICPVLACALPFAAGGFHTATTAVLCLFLTIAVFEQICKNGTVYLWGNRTGVSILLLFIAYCITPFWAADKGMAGFAFSRYLPLVLYTLLIMQSPDEIRHHFLKMLPFCGCLMTIVSGLAVLFPKLYPYVTVNGRLAGFFQYPNSFAAFLLVGLIIQSYHASGKFSFPVILLLTAGIVLSGSKTVFVLLLLLMAAIVLVRHHKALTFKLAAALLCGLAAGFLADALGLLTNADRFTAISASSGTFLVRLLYFRDVLPTILAHPLGIGYMGYPAIEGAIQTGRYYVAYIHNGFLQLLLEIGWIPTVFLIFSLLSAALSRKTIEMHRFILLAILCHCMLDFDLQFPVFWIILLSCTNLRSGKQMVIKACKTVQFVSAILVAVALWLGCGDWLYRMERPDLTLRITPFHTDALTYQMSVSTDPDRMDQLADRILSFNPTHSLAFSAKANVAFSRGDVRAMIRYKENAIHASRYTTNEYCDYFQKLYTAMQFYLQAGDTESAAQCRKKLLEIPEMMAVVSQQTHALADLTGDDSTLVLPPEYEALLQQLK